MWLTLVLACATDDEGTPRRFPKSQPTRDTSTEPTIERASRAVDLPDFSGYGSPIGPDATVGDGFGPRLLPQEGERPDFHTGLDLDAERGVELLAMGAGTVYEVDDGGQEGGRTLVIEHLVTPFEWHGESIDRFYAVYGHLESFSVEQDQAVEEGTVVGTVGDSGGAVKTHLHIEIRFGTPCSLRYAVDNPEDECGRVYDPAVNPLHIVPGYKAEAPTVEIIKEDPLVLRVATRTSDQDLNRVASDRGIVDLDERQGIDATTWEGLDDFDYGWLTIDPITAEPGATHREWNLVIPSGAEWVEVLDIRGEGWRIEP